MDLLLGYTPHPRSCTFPKLVYKLHKSIYGLRQASRQQYTKFSTALLESWFTQSQSNYNLFTKGLVSSFLALLVYVDDIIIAGPSSDLIQALNSELHCMFKLKDLGDLKYFLGLEIARSSQVIYLSQRNYTLHLLEDTWYLACKPTIVPMEPRILLTCTDGELLADVKQYKCIIGLLLISL